MEDNTIAELASLIGISAESLTESIARYICQQKAGVDDDFGRMF